LPLSREEFDGAIAAVEHYARSHNASWRRQRAVAMLLLLSLVAPSYQRRG